MVVPRSFPLLTGQVVELLGCKERRVHLAVRQGAARPQTIAGRRLWSATDVLALAKHMGLDSIDIRQVCQQAMAGQGGATEGGHRG